MSMNVTLEIIIDALQRVHAGERTPEQAALIMKNAAMLLRELADE